MIKILKKVEEGKMTSLRMREELRDQDWVVKQSINHLDNYFTTLRNKPRIKHTTGKFFPYFSPFH